MLTDSMAAEASGVSRAGEGAAKPVLIAHLSDLHLKSRRDDSSWPVWNSLHAFLVELSPQMVLITGDLADSPSRKVYGEIGKAIAALDRDIRNNLHPPVDTPVVWICAGNHDRHWRGNALLGRAQTHFDAETRLQPYIPAVQGGHSRVLGEDGNRWPVRILSVDTSRHARLSAQAFLPTGERERLRGLWTADAAEPPRLVILLFHHHLLPLPDSEAENQSWRTLVNLSGPVNPGKILEDLAQSQIDLVLHGHEHHVNRARYASYAPETAQVAMIAAGSATGMKTLEGCKFERASFNVLVLRADRSVWCQQFRSAEGDASWAPAGEAIELLDPTTLRQNMFYRAIRRQRRIENAQRPSESAPRPSANAVHVGPDIGPASEYEKHFILTATRDAHVAEKRTNWRIDNGLFTVVLGNKTGLPSAPEVHLELRLPPDTGPPEPVGLKPIRGEYRTWSFGMRLATRETVAAPRIRTSYLWQDAVLLNQSDFELIDELDRGIHRSEGREFVAAEIDRPLRNLTLSVSFPPGFLPDEDTISVFTERLDGPPSLEPEPSITARLQIAGQTVVLMLPYPLRGYRYDIAWTPPVGPGSSELARTLWSHAATESIGRKLADASLAAFADTRWRDQINVAAYIPVANPQPSNRFLRRIALLGYRQDHDNAPADIDLRTAAIHYTSAWWNDSLTVVAQNRETPQQRLANGMLAHEAAVGYVPVRQADDMRPPVAVLRVGLSLGQGTLLPDAVPSFERALARAAAHAISSILQEV